MTMRALSNLIYAAQGGNAINDTPFLIRTMRDQLVEAGADVNSELIRAAGLRARLLEQGLREARRVEPPNLWASFKAALSRLFDGFLTPFQARCEDWLTRVTVEDPTDLDERRARFIEEALELVQSLGMTEEDVRLVMTYVYSRPSGFPPQEFGGALTTLAVLAGYVGYDLLEVAEEELERVNDPDVIEKIRRKRSTRHGRGPLPGDSPVEVDPLSRAFAVDETGQLVVVPVDASKIAATDLRNGQASEKITGDMIPATHLLQAERAQLISVQHNAYGWTAEVRARHERIQEIDRELKRREKPADYSGMRLGSDTFLD